MLKVTKCIRVKYFVEALINIVCELKITAGSLKNCVKNPWLSDILLNSYVVKDTGWRNLIPVRLSTERTPCYMLIEALRNKLI